MRCKYGVITSQLHGCTLACTRRQDFIPVAVELCKAYVDKGYNKRMIDRYFERFIRSHLNGKMAPGEIKMQYLHMALAAVEPSAAAVSPPATSWTENSTSTETGAPNRRKNRKPQRTQTADNQSYEHRSRCHTCDVSVSFSDWSCGEVRKASSLCSCCPAFESSYALAYSNPNPN